METKTARIPKHSVREGFQQSFGTLPTLLTLLHSEGGGNQPLNIPIFKGVRFFSLQFWNITNITNITTFRGGGVSTILWNITNIT